MAEIITQAPGTKSPGPDVLFEGIGRDLSASAVADPVADVELAEPALEEQPPAVLGEQLPAVPEEQLPAAALEEQPPAAALVDEPALESWEPPATPLQGIEDVADADRAWFENGFKESRVNVNASPSSLNDAFNAIGISPEDLPEDAREFYQGPLPKGGAVEPSAGPPAGPPAEPSAESLVTDETLLSNKAWLYAASLVHEMMTGDHHPDLDAALRGLEAVPATKTPTPRPAFQASGDRAAAGRVSDYGKVWAAGFNWNMVDMGVSIYQLANQATGADSTLQASAAFHLLETYRRKGTTREDVYRSVGEVFSDPISIALLFTSFGLGNLLARSAAYTFRQGAIAFAKRTLPHAGIGAAVGGPEAGLHNAADQYIRVRAGVQPEVNLAELGLVTAAGAVLGGGVQGFLGPAIEGTFGVAVQGLVRGAQDLWRRGEYLQAIRDLEQAFTLRSAAAPEPGDFAARLPGPARREEQLPLIPDVPRQTAADLPGVPVAKMPVREPVPEARDLDELGFYSAALRLAENLQETGTPQQMRKALLNQAGVRSEELVWTGLDDLFRGRSAAGKKARITRAEIIEHLRNNRVKIGEVEGVKREEGGGEIDADTLPTMEPRTASGEEPEADDIEHMILSRTEDLRSGDESEWDALREAADVDLPEILRGAIVKRLKLDDSEMTETARGLAERAVDHFVNKKRPTAETYHELERVLWGAGLTRLDNPPTASSSRARWGRIVEDDLLSDSAVSQFVEDRATAQYWEDPRYEWEDNQGYGYSIVGSDYYGYIAMAPDGGSKTFDERSTAEEWITDAAIEGGYVKRLEELGESVFEEGYTMPGGTNYRELLLTFDPSTPAAPGRRFLGGHFEDEFSLTESGGTVDVPNVLAHARLKDRTVVREGGGFREVGEYPEKTEGNLRILSIEEIQSDWHKKRRVSGGGYEAPVYRKTSGRQVDVVAAEIEGLVSPRVGEAQGSFQEPRWARPREVWSGQLRRATGAVLDGDYSAVLGPPPQATLATVRQTARTALERGYSSVVEGSEGLARHSRIQASPLYSGAMDYVDQALEKIRISLVDHGLLRGGAGGARPFSEAFDRLRAEMEQAVVVSLSGHSPIRLSREAMVTQSLRHVLETWPTLLDKHNAQATNLGQSGEVIAPELYTYRGMTPSSRSARLADRWQIPPPPEDLGGALDKYNVLADEFIEIARPAAIGERPDAPYKSMDERGWPRLTIRRLIRYAAENGYDGVSWSPGEVQKKRYGAPTELYDKTIPKIVSSIIKRFNPRAKITTFQMGTDRIPMFLISDQMKESIGRLGQAIMAIPPIMAGVAAMDEEPEQAQLQ